MILHTISTPAPQPGAGRECNQLKEQISMVLCCKKRHYYYHLQFYAVQKNISSNVHNSSSNNNTMLCKFIEHNTFYKAPDSLLNI